MTSPILVIVGVGGGGGTGASTARVFAKAGYRIAIVARRPEGVNSLADSIKESGGEALPLVIPSYDFISFAETFRKIRSEWPGTPIRSAVFNAGAGFWKPFLEVKEEEIRESLDTNVTAAFGFAREAILAFKEQEVNELGKKGTLIFTGATAGLRGNKTTSAFAAGKFGLRALSQSLAKEFGPQGIHAAHAVIDGPIATDRAGGYSGPKLEPDSIAKSYLALTNQDKSAWTWELDCESFTAHTMWDAYVSKVRPSDESW